ncbi:hypothetical protein NJBCHELONAE_43750 [Mycobacteroides chelonae]|uniref:hypothetical protein n=1 Tax=Mycobacteroides chelonae TaxID=1774 RepID=UPI0021DEF810|nr:hypothetical protein [Mycobacteroides chelonae]GLE59064.1 hypothetical protein NJBCHELONAE_43750 [Mycobacteroides chelonae]
MRSNTVQITDAQAITIGLALSTVPTIGLADGAILRTDANSAVKVLDLDALVKTIARVGECLARTLRDHDATVAELAELRRVQLAMQQFLGTYHEPVAPEQGQP